MFETIKTLKLRIKDKHQKALGAMAREVNTVWNFCNETSSMAVRERHKFLSGFDLQKLTDGFSKCDGVSIGSATTQQVCEEYATRRRQFKRTRLNWRVSNPKSSRRSLEAGFHLNRARYATRQGRFIFAVSNWACGIATVCRTMNCVRVHCVKILAVGGI